MKARIFKGNNENQTPGSHSGNWFLDWCPAMSYLLTLFLLLLVCKEVIWLISPGTGSTKGVGEHKIQITCQLKSISPVVLWGLTQGESGEPFYKISLLKTLLQKYGYTLQALSASKPRYLQWLFLSLSKNLPYSYNKGEGVTSGWNYFIAISRATQRVYNVSTFCRTRGIIESHSLQIFKDGQH